MNVFRYKLTYVLLAVTSVLVILVALVSALAATTVTAQDGQPNRFDHPPVDGRAAITQTCPSPRYGHTLVRIGDKIYAFGGLGSSGTLNTNAEKIMPLGVLNYVTLNDLWEFNKDTDSWRKLNPQGDVPMARYGHKAAVANDKMYIFSGMVSDGYEITDGWCYDPVANAWTPVVPENNWPAPRVDYSMVTMDNKLYVFGGSMLNGAVIDSELWSYNLETNRWYRKTDSHATPPRYGHYAAVVDGKMYVIGGSNGEEPYINLLRYDPDDNSWLTIDFSVTNHRNALTGHSAVAEASEEYPNDLSRNWMIGAVPTGRAEMAGAAYGNRLLILGGVDGTGVELDEVWEFDVATISWRSLPPLPAPRRMAAAAILEEREGQVDVLLFGGISNGQIISDTLVYTVDVPPTYEVYLPMVTR